MIHHNSDYGVAYLSMSRPRAKRPRTRAGRSRAASRTSRRLIHEDMAREASIGGSGEARSAERADRLRLLSADEPTVFRCISHLSPRGAADSPSIHDTDGWG